MASQPQSGEKEVCLTLGMVRQWGENATKGQFLCIDAEKETCSGAENQTMGYKSCHLVTGLHYQHTKQVAFASYGYVPI